MKSLTRLSFVIIIIAFVFLLARNIHIGGTLPISSPKNKTVPLKGEWIVSRYKSINEKGPDKGSLNDWIGKNVYFSEDIAMLDKETCVQPQYKVKTINTGDYLLYTYKISPQELEIKNSEVDIISVTSAEKHFYDFISIDKDNLIVYVDKTFLFLEKVSDNIRSNDVAEKVKNVKIDTNSVQLRDEGTLRSGVLLGLKNQNTNSQPANNVYYRPDYRTVWIASRNKDIYSVRETEGLLVPRLNGFWKVDVKEEYRNNFLKEKIFAYSIENISRGSSIVREDDEIATNVIKNILFVGNDFISLEYGEGQEINSIYYDRLQVVPIDMPESVNKVKISDVEGENGKNALINSAKAYLTSNPGIKSEDIEKEPREDNFAMSRRNGHWIMKGRLDYLNPTNGKRYEDFNINILPSKKIVNFDELTVSWNAIKEKVPEALDAYTSPNKDIALIVTKSYIYIYGIDNLKISNKYIDKVKLLDNESVIMAEWATGEYVDRWDKVVQQDSAMPE